jgi:diguanylate cyclase (GGDEF)-like protein
MFDPQKIWQSAQLPTLPTVAVRLLELSQSSDTEIRDIVEVAKSDPAISAKLLKSANAAYFGLSHKVTTIERAVPLLGATVVTSLSLSFSLAEASMHPGPLADHYRTYWRRSVLQAVAAEVACAEFPRSLATECFLAGMLGNLGQLALLKAAPDDYLPALQRAAESNRPLLEVERELLGIDHIDIGVRLLKTWRIPEELTNPLELRWAPLEELLAGEDVELRKRRLAIAFAAAAVEYLTTSHKAQALERIKGLNPHLFGDDNEIPEVLAEVLERASQSEELFAVEMQSLGDPQELMSAANAQLAQLALREHVANTQASALQARAERERRELEDRHELLQEQTLHDPLTKVYNRKFFEESLDRELQRCTRHAGLIGVVFLDIDHFKKINDVHGHPCGDAVLARVAEALRGTLRNSDILARFGGEEFVVLASEPTEKGLMKLAERLRSRVEEEEILWDGERILATISVGAVLALPGRNQPDLGQQIVAAADEAMYESKRGGRNQVHVRVLVGEAERRIMRLVMQRRFSRWLATSAILDVAALSKALLQYVPRQIRIGELAVEQGWLTPEQIAQVLREQETTGARFGETAIRLGLLNEDRLITLLALQQEDPTAFADKLVQMQILEPLKAQAALETYLQVQPQEISV